MFLTVDQYRRSQRYLAQLLHFRDVGVPYDPNATAHPPDNDAAIDAVYTFFQHCYHLKDWAAKDPTSGFDWSAVESFVKNSPPLCVCADLANGSKHLGLRERETPKSGFRQRVQGSTGGWSYGENFKLTRIAIGSGEEGVGPVYDAFALAEQCMAEWDRLLGDRMREFLGAQ